MCNRLPLIVFILDVGLTQFNALGTLDWYSVLRRRFRLFSNEDIFARENK